MPAVQPGSKVLVTGANGFVAVWVIRKLLEAGYLVRGTIRSSAKGDHLREVFKDFIDRLELVVVPDIIKDGAFDEAVVGIDAIEHVASPFHFHANDPAELIEPAVKGTIGLLTSAMKAGPRIQRVVITSSTAAVARFTDKPILFNEDDWNDPSIQEVQDKGRDAPNIIKYFASKTLAERAAWQFMKEHQSSIQWDLVTIAPPYPSLNEIADPSSANTSVNEWYQTVLRSSKTQDELKFGNAWVDVRDVALAHVRSIQRSEAVGRIIVCAGSFVWYEWVNAVHSLTPSIYPSTSYPQIDLAWVSSSAIHIFKFDTSRAVNLLGITQVDYIPIEECARDMLVDFKSRGW
ncbi:hypothetical protein QCA50_004436 [Cerrena zonata]|uniref:NAD-dependent epimerase/dehydratase domain-containing protein n=1 Tax=Cerrena zonata TaxID=2478898 RepID=A0AAW0GS87_9APHY